jgi:hypothetical protein
MRRVAGVAGAVFAMNANPGIQIGPTVGHPCAELDIRRTSTGAAFPFKEGLAYTVVVLYTHFIRADGWKHTCATFDSVPAIVRPLVARMVRGRMRQILWTQGVLRHSDADIIEAGLRDWRAVLTVMSDGPFYFGDEPTGVDAIVFGALATTVLTPIESPVRDFLRAQPGCVAYAERMRARFFPELAAA